MINSVAKCDNGQLTVISAYLRLLYSFFVLVGLLALSSATPHLTPTLSFAVHIGIITMADNRLIPKIRHCRKRSKLTPQQADAM
jgi:hypothetical protein